MVALLALLTFLIGLGIGYNVGRSEQPPKRQEPEIHPMKYHEMDLPIKKINVN